MIADPVRLARRAGLLTIAGLALAGCSPRASSTHAGDERAAVRVAVFTAGGSSAPAGLVLPGRIKAREEVTLTARLAARVTALPVREGTHFRAGQPLALFEAPETRSAIRAARAALDAATLRLALARRQQARMESLFATGVVARRDLEVAESDARGAEADSAGARANAEQWSSGTSMLAPFDGVVVRRRVDPGASVSPGDALLDLRSDAVGEIEVAVPEGEIEAVKTARATFQLEDGPWLAAQLSRLDGMTDYATRTRTARLTARGVALDPGRFVRVRFETGTGRNAATAARSSTASDRVPMSSSPPAPGALSVPVTSLTRRGALAGVYVIADGRAELRWLRLGRAMGREVEVLAGLWPGEQVARSPDSLADGRRVTVAR